MTNIGNTPKNNTESWKNHRKWYIFLFLEPQKKITRVKYYPKDQIGWDALIDDPYELAFDSPFEDLEKDIQTEDADTEDADTEYVDTEDADTLDADLITRYKYYLKKHPLLLNREQEFWLALDIQA